MKNDMYFERNGLLPHEQIKKSDNLVNEVLIDIHDEFGVDMSFHVKPESLLRNHKDADDFKRKIIEDFKLGEFKYVDAIRKNEEE